MSASRLYAKAWWEPTPPPDSVFLPGHLREAHAAAARLLDSTGADQLRAVGLPPDAWLARLRRAVCLAAALHDLGKANDHFQGMVLKRPDRHNRQQGLRHEWVTLLMMEQPPLREWLRTATLGDEAAWLAVECAVTGHHPAYQRPSPPGDAVGGAGSDMLLHCAHQDFAISLCWLSETFRLGPVPPMGETKLSLLESGGDGAFRRLLRWSVDAQGRWDRLSGDEQRFIAAAKACLIGADVAGSALPKAVADEQGRADWISTAFANAPTPEDLGEIITARLTDRRTGKVEPLRAFQEQTAQSSGQVTLLRAGCGTGKTLAAYHWARTRHPGKRLYICYPTTGTATEGYRGYLWDEQVKTGRGGARLFHGRADVDLEIILGAPDDETEDDALRIESLDAWSTPIVSCTVDTVLGLLQNHRTGLYAWPALAGAAFVFDEIHAYDEKLFGALLCFLEKLSGVPVLLMTASLPAERLTATEDVLRRRGGSLTVAPRTPDLAELEELPRYHPHEGADPWPVVRAELEAGGKVLWVCNTVDRAIAAARQAKAFVLSPFVYHRRFGYEDRVKRHKAVVHAFGPESSSPALAICTQVAEMSLDISATMLVSELAPVPFLIQRLGRLNRRPHQGDPTRPFILIEPVSNQGKFSTAPYDPADYGDWPRITRKWLSALPRGAIAQRNLSEAWERLQDSQQARRFPRESAWLKGGPHTTVAELRQGSPGITVIREEDLPEAKNKSWKHVALPMPQPKARSWQQWRRFKGIPVAPTGSVRYDKERGGEWSDT